VINLIISAFYLIVSTVLAPFISVERLDDLCGIVYDAMRRDSWCHFIDSNKNELK
jgi:hypothetical protein